MTKIRGVGLDHLHEQEAAFETAVVDAMTSAIRVMLKSGAVHRSAARLSIDDLNVLPAIWRPYAQKLAETVRDRFVQAANEQAQHMSDATGRPVVASADLSAEPLGLFTSENSAAVNQLANATNRLVGVGDDLWANARSELTLGMQQGESIPNLAKRVEGAIDTTKGRATTIARTQIVSASNAGSIAYMRSTGETARKQWLATGDARTRLSHQEADGQDVGLDEAFSVGGDDLDCPGDESGSPEEVINCRCTMTYSLNDDEPAVQSLTDDSGATVEEQMAQDAEEQTVAPEAISRVAERASIPAQPTYSDGIYKNVYHATSSDAAGRLEVSGFDPSFAGTSNEGGSFFGQGVYFHTTEESATKSLAGYREYIDSSMTQIRADVTLRNPFEVTATVGDTNPSMVMRRALEKEGYISPGEAMPSPSEITAMLQSDGFDGVRITQTGFNHEIAGNQVVVFDPGAVTVVNRAIR